jgi:hypothetical protein
MTNTLSSSRVSHFDPVAPSNMTRSIMFPLARSRRRFGTWVGTNLGTLMILTTFSNIQLTTVNHSQTSCIFKGDSF